MPRITPGVIACHRRAVTPCFTCKNPDGELRRDLPLRFVCPEMATLCGRCWLQFGGKAAPSEAGAAPRAALEVRSAQPTEWGKLFQSQEWVGLLRRDARERVGLLFQTLRNWSDWTTAECWPTWARLQAATGWGRSTLAGWLRQLWILGWIDRIEPGSTPEFRPMGSPVEGNRAAVYALRVPAYAERQEPAAARREYTLVLAELTTKIALLKRAEGKNWTPSVSFDLDSLVVEVGYLRTRASEIFHNLGSAAEVGTNTKIEPLRGRFENKRGRAWDAMVPTTGAEMLAAAAELRRQHPVFGRMTDLGIRHVCRSWWRAGWCNEGILHALRYQPVGWSGTSAAHSHPGYAVIHPMGWAKARLSIWRSDLGKPLPDPSRTRVLRPLVAEGLEGQREQDTAMFGRAGAELLRTVHAQGEGYFRERDGASNPHVLGQLVQAVAARGRNAAAQLAREQRADASRAGAMAHIRQLLGGTPRATSPVARGAVQLTDAQKRSIAAARAALQAKADATSPATTAPAAGGAGELDGLDPAERSRVLHQRALERNAAAGRHSWRNRRRP